MAGDNKICEHGTRADAVKAAEKLFLQMSHSDCHVWALHVAFALSTICVDVMVENLVLDGMPRDMARAGLKEVKDAMTADTRAIGSRPSELLTFIYGREGGHG